MSDEILVCDVSNEYDESVAYEKHFDGWLSDWWLSVCWKYEAQRLGLVVNE